MSSGQNYMLNLNKFNAMHKLGSSPIGYDGFVQPRLVAKAKQNEICITIILSVSRICICICIFISICICISLSLSISIYIYLSIYLPIYLSIHLSIYLSIYRLSLYRSPSRQAAGSWRWRWRAGCYWGPGTWRWVDDLVTGFHGDFMKSGGFYVILHDSWLYWSHCFLGVGMGNLVYISRVL